MRVREGNGDLQLLGALGHLRPRWHRVPLSKCQLFLKLFPPAQLACGLGLSTVYSSLCFPPPSTREQGEVGPAHRGVAASGKSVGTSTKWRLDADDGACAKTHECLPPSAHLHCNFREASGVGRVQPEVTATPGPERAQDAHTSALRLSL